MRRYAQETSVPVARSKAAIEDLLRQHGASEWMRQCRICRDAHRANHRAKTKAPCVVARPILEA